MKVSIITATYNSASTIGDTLSSVAKQDYQDIEHLIIDGNSKDDTLAVVAQFPHVRTVISEKDRGIYDAMNKGIGLATGDIVGILNSDDFYNYDTVLSEVVSIFNSDDEIQCLYADLNYVDQKDTKKIVRKWVSGEYSTNAFKRGWMPPHPTFFVKKELYEKFGLFNLSMGTAADYELMLRYLVKHQCKVAYLPKTIINMRLGGVSNASFLARIKANKADRMAWVINDLKPSIYTFILKPLRKIIQYI